MNEFTGKVVLITGAGKGLGRTLAETFAAQGAVVAANDISPINLDETVARIRSAGGQVKDYVFDIAKQLPVHALVMQVFEDFGRIDFLINNAAVHPRGALLTFDEWDWQRAFDVNLSGPFFLLQEVGRIMHEQGRGVVVNIGADLPPASLAQASAAYLASKSGLVGLTRAAAAELGAYNIRINLVYPATAAPAAVASQVLYLCSQEAAGLTGQTIQVE